MSATGHRQAYHLQQTHLRTEGVDHTQWGAWPIPPYAFLCFRFIESSEWCVTSAPKYHCWNININRNSRQWMYFWCEMINSNLLCSLWADNLKDKDATPPIAPRVHLEPKHYVTLKEVRWFVFGLSPTTTGEMPLAGLTFCSWISFLRAKRFFEEAFF